MPLELQLFASTPPRVQPSVVHNTSELYRGLNYSKAGSWIIHLELRLPGAPVCGREAVDLTGHGRPVGAGREMH